MVHVKSHVHCIKSNRWDEVLIFVVIAEHPHFFFHTDWKLTDLFFGKCKLLYFEQADQRFDAFGDVSNCKYTDAMNG